jgi:hypothetical protein
MGYIDLNICYIGEPARTRLMGSQWNTRCDSCGACWPLAWFICVLITVVGVARGQAVLLKVRLLFCLCLSF